MAGPKKDRAADKRMPQGPASTDTAESSRESGGIASQRSTPHSIPPLDGVRDPKGGLTPVDYSRPNDLKNISEFLGIGGWYAARGVRPSSTPFVPLFSVITS
jgi:eukaryotic translation initiation factor 2C